MALKVLRGTTAQRTAYVPAVGEPVWDTDTSKLYVGDGTTLGGIAVDIANNSLELNDLDNVITGALTDGDSLVYNAGSTVFEAGDATRLGDKSIDQLSDIDLTTPATTGQVLKWNGTHFAPADDASTEGSGIVPGALYVIDITGDVTGDLTGDSAGTHTGAVVGNVTGDVTGNLTGELTGNVYADANSALIVDATNNSVATTSVVTNIIKSSSPTGAIVLENNNRTPVQITSVTDGGAGGFPYTDFLSVRGSVEAPTAILAGDVVGGFKISAYDAVSGEGKVSGLLYTSIAADGDVTEDFPKSSATLLVGAGAGTYNSYMFGEEGTFKSPGAITPGIYADASARDTAITAPTAGMMVFVTDVTKFQGYTGSAWVDLN